MVLKRYFMIPFLRTFLIVLTLGISNLLDIFGYGLFLDAVAQESSFKAQPTDNLNAVLLLDSSASMLVNDPDKLRDQGARLLLQFLKSGDNLAIVKFDETAQIVRPLSPFGSDQLPAIQSMLNSIEASGQYTDLNAGLQVAQSIVSKLATNDGRSVIIMLSDGKMDPSPTKGSAESHLDQLTTKILPSIKSLGVKVYTLAFSQDTDRPLLQHIAQSTDGINWFTPNSDTIHESFADLFLSLKKPQVVPYSSKGFKIEPNVEEATFYINQPENVKIQVEDPNEEKFSAEEPGEEIRWFDGKKFSVITISHPQAGEWKLIGVNPDDGFATILTNLKLVTDWPNAIPVAESVLLQARLYEGKLPVDLEAIAQAVSFAFQVTPSDRVSEPIIREFLGDEGKNGDEKSGDGIFSHKIKIDQAGEFKLRIIAKGPTFERQLQIPFRVRPPLMTFTVEEPKEHTKDEASGEHGHTDHKVDAHSKDNHAKDEHANGPPHTGAKELTDHSTKSSIIAGSQRSLLRVKLNEEASAIKDIGITISAVDKNRNKTLLTAELEKNTHSGDEKVYQVSADTLPEDGLYELRALLKAKSRDGKAVSEESAVVKFTRKTIHETQTEPKPGPTTKPDVATEQPEKTEKQEEVSGFDWVALVMVVLINSLLGAGLFVLLKKKNAKAGDSSNFDLPPVSAELLTWISDLEKRAQLDSVDIEDEKFSQAESGATSTTEAGPSVGEGEALKSVTDQNDSDAENNSSTNSAS